VIVNPYFLPGEIGLRMMKDAAARNVHTTIFTNSLASTDEPLVHRAYARFRLAMLQLGVGLYELNPVSLGVTRDYGDFGRSTARLHVKGAAVDGRWLLVGSVNLDARSALHNTELAVVIDCPPLVDDALLALGGEPWRAMYRVTLGDDRQTLRWQAIDDGNRASTIDDEPTDSVWQRFVHWLQSLFVKEDQL
jgi:putative cardiolipin synthase